MNDIYGLINELTCLAFACGLFFGILMSILFSHLIREQTKLRNSKAGLLCKDCQEKYYKLFGKSIM